MINQELALTVLNLLNIQFFTFSIYNCTTSPSDKSQCNANHMSQQRLSVLLVDSGFFITDPHVAVGYNLAVNHRDSCHSVQVNLVREETPRDEAILLKDVMLLIRDDQVYSIRPSRGWIDCLVLGDIIINLDITE